MSSFFQYSSTRSNELKKIAKANDLNVLSMPKLFTIRRVEYTYNLVRAILTSWHATVIFLEAEKNVCAKANGFLRNLKNLNFLKMLTFLGDLLRVYKRMQKKFQSNSLTLLKMSKDIDATIALLDIMKKEPIAGGFECKLKDSVNEVEGGVYLKDVELDNYHIPIS